MNKHDQNIRVNASLIRLMQILDSQILLKKEANISDGRVSFEYFFELLCILYPTVKLNDIRKC